MRESTVISITNSKGGVGKTTTALNLGAALAAAKKRVLLIDNDPQGNLTAALGYTPGEQKNTLAKLVLVQIDSPEDLDLHLPRTVIHTETGIDLGVLFGTNYHSFCSDDFGASPYTSYYRHDSGGCLDWRTRLSCARPRQ